MTVAGSELADAVSRYVDLGLTPIPIVPGAKNPSVPWEEYQRRRPTDEEMVRWWKNGVLGVGIITGTISGNLLVLDFEERTTFEDFLDANPDLAQSTLCVYTGKGGHVYLRTAYPVQSRGMASHPWLRAHRVELSGEARQVLAPPSTHPNGKQYRVRPGSPVDVVPIGDPVEYLHAAFDAMDLSFPIEVIQRVGEEPRTFRQQAPEARAGATERPSRGPRSWDDLVGKAHTTGSVVARTVGEETIDGEWHQTVTSVVGRLARQMVPMEVIESYLEKARSTSSWGQSGDRAFERAYRALLKSAEEWREQAVAEAGSDPYEDGEDAGGAGAGAVTTPEGLAERRVDLRPHVEGEIPPPNWLIEDVLVRAHVHLLYGEPGCGKTILALAWAIQVLASGGTVLLVDEESGVSMTASRLKAMGVEPEWLERLHYFPFAGITLDEADALAAYCLEHKPDLVLFDAMADVLSASRLDENAGPDVTRWMMGVPVRISRGMGADGPAVALLDHSTKDLQNKSYSRGSGAKKAKSDVSWYVEKTADFDHALIGRITLSRTKNRIGIMPERVQYEAGGQGGVLVCKRLDVFQRVVSTLSAGARKALHLMELEGGEWTNQRLREAWTTDGSVRVGAERARQILAELTDAGRVQKRGDRTATVYFLPENQAGNGAETALPNYPTPTQLLPNSWVGHPHVATQPPTTHPPKGGGWGVGYGDGGVVGGGTQLDEEEDNDDDEYEYLSNR